MEFENSKRISKKAHQLIPGGCHTYAKGDDQFPELSPGFIMRGKGCHVWDVDGNEFIEYNMGLRAVTLGHAYEPVVNAAYEQMLAGANFTRPSPLEVECAELILSLIDSAEHIKFAKDGSSVTTAAVKLSRAYTGKDMVAVCADHPFLSYNDWFFSTTTMKSGIPKILQSLTVTFEYNNIASVEALFSMYGDKLACLIMEPARIDEPKNNFLRETQKLCKKHGVIFILDEMITGFRWSLPGAQTLYDIQPDLSTFGKALANGFSLSALVGRKEIMELGGLETKKERVFLLSTTHGAETHSLAAAIKTIEIFKNENVIEHLYAQGNSLIHGISSIVNQLGLQDHFKLMSRPCNLMYSTFDRELKASQPYRTLFLQELIRQKIIAPSFVVSYSHTNDDIEKTIVAVEKALKVYRNALEEGIDKYLIGRAVKPVFRKFN